MLHSMLRARRESGRAHAFSLVEILIVILIIAVLLAVALPQLLGSRDSGLDSAAKQQLKNALSEISAYTLRTETVPADEAAAQAVVKNIDITAGESGLVTGTNARSVSYAPLSASAGGGFVVAVKGAKTTCWAIAATNNETFYYGALTGACTASGLTPPTPGSTPAAGSQWKQFGFPSEAL